MKQISAQNRGIPTSLDVSNQPAVLPQLFAARRPQGRSNVTLTISSKHCQNFVRISSEYQISFEYHQNIVRISSEHRQNIVRISSKYRQNSVRISSAAHTSLHCSILSLFTHWPRYLQWPHLQSEQFSRSAVLSSSRNVLPLHFLLIFHDMGEVALSQKPFFKCTP